ncbi:hypothetical protein ACET3Z_022033 [Daucus carota]
MGRPPTGGNNVFRQKLPVRRPQPVVNQEHPDVIPTQGSQSAPDASKINSTPPPPAESSDPWVWPTPPYKAMETTPSAADSESEYESYSEEEAAVPPRRSSRLRKVAFKKNKSNKKNTTPDDPFILDP